MYPKTVGNYHMAFVEDADAAGVPQITFLYKLTKGTCNNSYGLNVARLAEVCSFYLLKVFILRCCCLIFDLLDTRPSHPHRATKGGGVEK